MRDFDAVIADVAGPQSFSILVPHVRTSYTNSSGSLGSTRYLWCFRWYEDL